MTEATLYINIMLIIVSYKAPPISAQLTTTYEHTLYVLEIPLSFFPHSVVVLDPILSDALHKRGGPPLERLTWQQLMQR